MRYQFESGTGADSEIFPQWLDAPPKVYVVDGPTVADGYTWYLVTSVLEPVLEATPSGWVAAAGKDGEPWLVPYAMPCRVEPSMDELLAMQALQRLGCYGGREFTLEGFLRVESASQDISMIPALGAVARTRQHWRSSTSSDAGPSSWRPASS